MVPFFSARDVAAAVPPERAYAAVREAFVAHARGEWTMQPKLYVPSYPAGDFRAMPALGGGHALLKWVTSFPGNPALGLPTVTGLVVLSNSGTGMVEAILDAGAVTALRTGAAAVIAADVLGRPDASTAAVIGAGVNGKATARTFVTLGRAVSIWDLDARRAAGAAEETGATMAPSLEDALAADLVVTVTPGREILLQQGSLRPGQHVNLMGADGPGKSEIAIAELARGRISSDEWERALPGGPEPLVRVFCDDWKQASKSGDLKGAVEARLLGRDDVTQLGDVLVGVATGRQHDDDITVFDSTGLAIQDLAIALAALDRAGDFDLATFEL